MFNKQQFAEFRKDVEKALEEVAKKHNVNITAGKINYSDISFDLKLEVKKVEVNGKSFEQAEFEKVCTLYGFTNEDYAKKAIYQGKEFSLVGFNLRKRKSPVMVKSSDGKGYGMPEELAKLLFKKEA